MEHEAFYTTAAQVIPVLLLALFVEERLSPREREAQHVADDLAYLALLLFGEMTALTALLEGPGRYSEGIVTLALFGGFMVLGVRMLNRLGAAVSPWIPAAAYLTTLALLGGLGYFLGNDSLPLTGFILFAAASFAAMVVRTRKDVRKIKSARTEREAADDDDDDDDEGETAHGRARPS